jgi:hypothetical protein
LLWPLSVSLARRYVASVLLLALLEFYCLLLPLCVSSSLLLDVVSPMALVDTAHRYSFGCATWLGLFGRRPRRSGLGGRLSRTCVLVLCLLGCRMLGRSVGVKLVA